MEENAVYLDYAATAPLSEASFEAMKRAFEIGGNPSSLHASGRAARWELERARQEIASYAGADPSELIFTSSGTEADNLALKGLYWSRRKGSERRRRILVTGIEHHAVLDSLEWLESHEGAVLEIIPVDEQGMISLEEAQARLERFPDEFALGTLMWANNEMGAVQPVEEFVQLCAQFGVPVHSDAVQALGSLPLDFAQSALATMAVSGHKLGAPVGIGALFVRRDVALEPLMHGGGQERSIRSGTLDVASAAAFAAALPVSDQEQKHGQRLRQLQSRLIEEILQTVPGAVLNGPDPRNSPELRLPGNVNFSFPGAEGDSLLFLLDAAGIRTSTGSACTAGVARPSHVILALSGDEERARGTQRFSMGRGTLPSDIDRLMEVLPEIVKRARQAGLSAAQPKIRTASTQSTTQ